VSRCKDASCAKDPAVVAATTVGILRASPNAPIRTPPKKVRSPRPAPATGSSKGAHAGLVKREDAADGKVEEPEKRAEDGVDLSRPVMKSMSRWTTLTAVLPTRSSMPGLAQGSKQRISAHHTSQTSEPIVRIDYAREAELPLTSLRRQGKLRRGRTNYRPSPFGLHLVIKAAPLSPPLFAAADSYTRDQRNSNL